MSNTTLTIAHWVTNLATPVSSLEDWCALIGQQMVKARGEKADILLIPEYISEHWMHFAPADQSETEEIAWMAAQAQKILPALQEIVTTTGVALVAGSMPWPQENGTGFTNRSWFLFPDREAAFHDKLVMTPFEKDPQSWELQTGGQINIVEWRGFRMTTLICLDIEMPALSCLLSPLDIDLILVPSQTEKTSGYHRVFDCAKARAIEMLAAIAVVGCVGAPEKGGQKRSNYHSGAALYVPCEEKFGFTGIFADLSVSSGTDQPGEMLISRDVPLGAIRAIRHGKPEVWPGPWSADGIQILSD